jgi:DNA-binding GntR family transcriptional regulator
VLSKRLLVRGVAPEGVMAAGFGGAAVLLVPVLLVAGPGFLAAPGGIALALYLGAIPTALAYVLFSRGLRALTSGETATLVLAEPLTAAALGVVALGEHPSAAAAAGAVLVLCGLAVSPRPGGAGRSRRGWRCGGMSAPEPLRRASTVDQLAGLLRARILDGELQPAGASSSAELVEAYDVARHRCAPALRRLEGEGPRPRRAPTAGARVADLSHDDLVELFALRPGPRARGRVPGARARRRPAPAGGARRRRGPRPRRAAAQRVLAGRRRPRTTGCTRRSWSAAGAPRIERAYAALSTELDLFLSQLRPVWTRERLGPDHLALVRDLERDGPDVLREHMAAALRALHPDASKRH